MEPPHPRPPSPARCGRGGAERQRGGGEGCSTACGHRGGGFPRLAARLGEARLAPTGWDGFGTVARAPPTAPRSPTAVPCRGRARRAGNEPRTRASRRGRARHASPLQGYRAGDEVPTVIGRRSRSPLQRRRSRRRGQACLTRRAVRPGKPTLFPQIPAWIDAARAGAPSPPGPLSRAVRERGWRAERAGGEGCPTGEARPAPTNNTRAAVASGASRG